MFIKVNFNEKPMLINTDYIMRVRESLEYETGSQITFHNGGNQEVDEDCNKLTNLIVYGKFV